MGLCIQSILNNYLFIWGSWIRGVESNRETRLHFLCVTKKGDGKEDKEGREGRKEREGRESGMDERISKYTSFLSLGKLSNLCEAWFLYL